jgi:SAM-dependent methyltransferase
MTDCKSTAKSLSEWFATGQGSYVLTREQAWFDRTVNDIFGYNALQLGLPAHDFLRNSRIPLRFTGADQPGATVRLCGDELPIDSASLDLVLLPHILEFSEQPHAILREVERVLMPEGSLLISGFNPHSLWGLHRKFVRQRGYPGAVILLRCHVSRIGWPCWVLRWQEAGLPPMRRRSINESGWSAAILWKLPVIAGGR